MNTQKKVTLNKSLLLNWLYLTNKEVSLEELSRFIEEKTNGEYSIQKTS